MKQYLLALVIAFVSIGTKAQEQSLTIDGSQMVSTFRFINSNNEKQNVDYQSILTSSYGVGYRCVFDNNIILKGGFGKRNGGANYVYDNMNYSWDLEYVDVKLGGGYLFDIGRFSPYLLANGYYGFLLRGIQVLNNEEFNIKESGLLEESDYGVIGNLGVNFKMSDFVTVYAEAQYLFGLGNIEKEADQIANNRAYGITLGLSFNITK